MELRMEEIYWNLEVEHGVPMRRYYKNFKQGPPASKGCKSSTAKVNLSLKSKGAGGRSPISRPFGRR
jgi:hypothetical protein